MRCIPRGKGYTVKKLLHFSDINYFIVHTILMTNLNHEKTNDGYFISKCLNVLWYFIVGPNSCHYELNSFFDSVELKKFVENTW